MCDEQDEDDGNSEEDDGIVRGKNLLPDDDKEALGTKFERQQRDIGERIKRLEEFNVGDKPWQLSGGWSFCGAFCRVSSTPEE